AVDVLPSGFVEKLAGLVHVVLVCLDIVRDVLLVGERAGKHRRAAAIELLDDHGAVDRVHERLADRRVLEALFRQVKAEVIGNLRRAREDLQAFFTLHRGGLIGRQVGELDLAGPESDHAAASLREVAVDEGVELRASAPVILIGVEDRKSTRLNSSHVKISYAVFYLKK